MSWRGAARVGRVCGVAIAVAGFLITARPAAAQDTYERMLAGIRLNSTAKSVLARYGNPNEVIIGDVGFRQAPPQPGAGGMGMAGSGGMMGAPGGMGDMPGSGGMPMDGGGMSGPMGGRGMMGAPGGMSGGMSGMPMGGAPMGAPGGMSGMSGMPMGGPSMGGPSMGGPGGMSGMPGGMSGMPGGMGGMPSGMGGMPGGDDFPGRGGGMGMGGPGAMGGGGVGQFGQTISTLARQQEVTWIYNRKIGNNMVSYEFLIGPGGNVTQIRVSGYSGGNSKTRRGATLGSTYKQIVALYGYPEEHYQVGRILVASYRKKHHVQFQLMNERGQANPMAAGNKVVAITIATVE
jgi:hypothetical protein